ncbi:MAG: hypothetical protein GY754_41490 [bacterium]|nr:hypothetical protein [bacterium]
MKPKAKKPTSAPISVYIQEAANLHRYSQEDKKELISKGLSEDLLEDLPKRTRQLINAESDWAAEQKTREENRERWAKEIPAAKELRNELLRSFRFAYRNNPELLKTVRAIKKGNSNSAIIQALNDLSVVGTKTPGPLEQTGFNMAKLEAAAHKSKELPGILGEARAKEVNKARVREIRDRAYTHLKEAVDEIRKTGRHVFKNNEERRKLYANQYRKKVNTRYIQKTGKKKNTK